MTLQQWLVGPNHLDATQWLQLFSHFVVMSMLSIGGAIAVAPEMQRFIVGEHGWLSDTGFTTSIAIAQAAPGPNVLFVPVVGFNVGGMAGLLVSLVGILLPSTTLALAATRWGQRRRHTRGVRAFVAGMAPVTIGLLGSTGWVLAEPMLGKPGAAVLLVGTVAVMAATKISPVWLIAVGAVVGALGWA